MSQTAQFLASMRIAVIVALSAEHIVPRYQLLFECIAKAQNAERVGKETKLDRLDVGNPAR